MLAEVDGGEVGSPEDQDHHGAEPVVAQQADVLDLVALLDEADRLLDAPAREIAFDQAPDASDGSGRGARWSGRREAGAKALRPQPATKGRSAAR